MKLLPIFLSDSYKQFHHLMYPEDIELLYSNMTPRSFKRLLGCEHAVFFGLQYYIKKYLMEEWNTFFATPFSEIERQYRRFHKHFSGCDVTVDHWKKLHDLGYMPIVVYALPEGSLVPEKVPFYTIYNTHPDFAWLVNFLETQMSTVIWDMTTVATIAHMYRQKLDKWAEKTGDPSFVQWQGHDFSMRGRSSMESAYACQAGHLLSFTGTDTIPAVFMLEDYYDANIEKELVGGSVPATEHSVMTSYGKEEEIVAFERLLDLFPSGVLSIVSDSFDLWKVCTEYVTTLKDKIMARNGKLVIRPDSGDPVDIVCGTIKGLVDYQYTVTNAEIGVVELLWNVFGGTVNEKGYKVLDPHIGVIYGDSITLDRAEQICQRLADRGFASTNVVFGIGSYTYNHNTRDTLGTAIKATFCRVGKERREIFKDPVTDDGVKKSARGLLKVVKENGELKLQDQCNAEDFNNSDNDQLKLVFAEGHIIEKTSLNDIRNRLRNG